MKSWTSHLVILQQVPETLKGGKNLKELLSVSEVKVSNNRGGLVRGPGLDLHPGLDPCSGTQLDTVPSEE